MNEQQETFNQQQYYYKNITGKSKANNFQIKKEGDPERSPYVMIYVYFHYYNYNHL